MLLRSEKAFTLVELLISMTLVGTITTFTIPKILSSQQNMRQKAVFAETISALNEIFVNPCLRGEITEANVGSYFRSHLNAVKICTSDSMAEGCWFGTDLVAQGHTEGVVMHNGAVIAGLDDAVGTSGTDTFMIDWDGSSGLNTHGQDQMILKAIINNSTTSDRVCTVRWDVAHTGSKTLWLNTFD